MRFGRWLKSAIERLLKETSGDNKITATDIHNFFNNFVCSFIGERSKTKKIRNQPA
jgi:hypothetical protein